jgi:hypothetical protein
LSSEEEEFLFYLLIHLFVFDRACDCRVQLGEALKNANPSDPLITKIDEVDSFFHLKGQSHEKVGEIRPW